MEITSEKLEKAILKVLTRNKDADPITMAEKIAERIEILFEDADGGYGVNPVHIVREEEEQIPEETWRTPIPRSARDKYAKREEPTSPFPPAPKSSLIVDPSSEEFRRAVEEHSRNRGPVPVRVSQLNEPAPGPGTAPTRHWSYENLGDLIHRSTPPEMYFTPNGKPGVQVKAVRNVHQLQGMDLVRLEYSNPGVNGDSRPEDPEGDGAFVIGLTASHAFSLTERNVDIDKAMESIVTQLEGLYGSRENLESEVPLPPSPMDNFKAANNPMSGKVEVRLEQGWSKVGSGTREVQVGSRTYTVPDTDSSLLGSVRSENQRYGNKGQ